MIKMAVEVGGTFTDLIWIEDGEVKSQKVPSTPEDASEGVISGLHVALGKDLSRMSELCHGSTVATNAIIERRGCRAALVTTRGFRDVLELQRQLRADVYAIALDKPEPLVPLHRSIEAPERLDARGAVIEPLDEASLIDAVEDLIEREAPEAVAVCLLHSYLNPQHEDRIRALLAERYPDLPVILSSDVLPTFREYERASTTAMAAYLAPLVGRYIGRLEHHIAEHAPQSDLFVMQSSGGVLPGGGSLDHGVHMLNSGPAAGVIGAVRVAAVVGDANVITLDIGGTSTDIALIRNGTVGVTAETDVNGLPVGLPSTDIANIGAGGGSLGYIDRGGMLKVGPRSAGARPGPACYGHGGTAPAITDALVQLGWIRPHRFLGGKMALHLDRATEALATLGPSASESAQAMIDIAIAHIGQGIRFVSVQRGHDAKNFALFGYGGMGPMMSALAAEDLKIGRVVIPPHPGLFSALGLLVSDLKRIYRETNLMKVDEHASVRVAESFERMRERAVEEFTRLGRHRDELVFDYALEMRYSGQGFELLTEIDLDELSTQGQEYLERLFNNAHVARYGSVSRDPVEIVTLRLVAQIPADGNTLRELTRGPSDDAFPEIEESAVTFHGTQMQCQFAWRKSLPKGHVLNGPAIVEEPTATTLVPSGWRATVHETGSLILEKETQA